LEAALVNTMPLFAEGSPGDSHDISPEVRPSVSRADAIYGAHAYHTKVPPEAIKPFLLEHTRLDDLVLDPFCGSGMTGLAASQLGRRAWLGDLSPAAVHIARNYTTPCDPFAYTAAADRLISESVDLQQGLYGTTCHGCGGAARVAYVIWSDVRGCPTCGTEHRIWDHRDGSLRKLICSRCKTPFQKGDGPLLREEPVRINVHCPSCGRLERDPQPPDLDLAHIDPARIDAPYPRIPFDRNREMWRRGHADLGITEVAHFYTPRNLWALARLWSHIENVSDERLRDGLRFTFTAIANRASKRYQWNAKRPTNVLGGTLYIASLRYEFNVFDLWSRKVRAVTKLFEATSKLASAVEAHQASATQLPLPDASIDYCFTDPPFGANIVYSDCSLLWEAWLGRLTDRVSEAVVTRQLKSGDGGKDISAYGDLMAGAFKELRRVLKLDGRATMVFQNTDPKVWSAVQEAIGVSGLVVESAETLHKAQPSFKGVKAQQEGERVAATDVVLHLRSGRRPQTKRPPVWDLVWPAVLRELEVVDTAEVRRRSTGHLYAVAVAAAVGAGLPTSEITFELLESRLRERFTFAEGWQSPANANVSG
jgi:16S rRNA G966 N2-methylase RsmD